LMGAKASSEMIRNENDTATVEGEFDISQRPDLMEKLRNMGIDTEGELIVRRLVSAQGKSRVYINGSLSPLTTLQDLVAPLIEVTGNTAPLIEMTAQAENRNLLSKAYHLLLLDRFCATVQLKKEFGEKYQRLLDIEREIEEIQASEKLRAQKLDFLTFQRDEIKALQIRPGEEEELENEYLRLRYSSQLHKWAQEAEETLYTQDDSALVRVHRVIQRAQDLAQFDKTLLTRIESLQQAKTLIEDCVHELRAYSESLDAEPERLDQLEKRRSDLKHLQKKYGATVSEILSALENIESEIAGLEGSEDRLKDLAAERDSLKKELQKMGDDLHRRRRSGAELLANEVNDELGDLNMKGVIFEVQIEKLDHFTATGVSDVEFVIKSSAKDKARPLGKSASGGELSRILLALKNVVGQADVPRTYLFDEVDTGVSGTTAEKVGRKLKTISKGQQVICVTHLPQVACAGDVHFLIEKSVSGKRVATEIRLLKKDERVNEVARLISGEKITKTSIAHAKQLLEL
ncbi:MAG TPA: DNA repair protein RecN, partial [Bdellovibrionales bacterium]|nr:DNA repair protein RecN [Bdellovibrionales bacterium]